MIYVELCGGLGNQLFQYAIGRYFSIKYDTGLIFNIRNLKNFSTKRSYHLKNFNIDCKTTKSVNNVNIVFERTFHYNPEIEVIVKNNSYLKGYWQSEKYFKSARNVILQELTPKIKLSPLYYKYKDKINETLSVGIHIRRTDYLLKGNFEFHGVCSLEYYQNAINYIKHKINDIPTLFVFSDDISWAKDNFKKIGYSTYFVTSETNVLNTQIDELLLMSLCKHNIIANSTFSWWAAWINQNVNKIVMAPKNWFSNNRVNSKDIFLSEWVKI